MIDGHQGHSDVSLPILSDEYVLHGKVAVVTGATRGLGRAVCDGLVDAGAKVVLVARSTDSRPHKLLPGTLEGVAADLRSRGGEVLAVTADLSDREQVARAVDETLEWAGSCDVLVANASYTPAGNFFEVPLSRWATGFNITVLAMVGFVQGVLPGMLDRGHGRVLAIGSGSAAHDIEPRPGWSRYEPGQAVPLLYGATKAALERVTTGLHDEFGGLGVSFNNLRAGPFTSEAWHLMSGKMGKYQKPEAVHTPEEVAAAVIWMLRRPASYSGRIVDFSRLTDAGVLPPLPRSTA